MKSIEMADSPRSHDQSSLTSSSSPNFNCRGRNVVCLLARREISPRIKHTPKQHWGERDVSRPKYGSLSRPKNEVVREARRGLLSWAEAESLRHLSAKYCSLWPPPRSTIAAAFSSDGKVLASTHGDHTVKIIDYETRQCLKVLVGHRRTPWVVRFHPLQPQILASGSLDQEVCIWDVVTTKCLFFYRFYRSIASIAFHANGEILAVASGHKLYMWPYNNRGEESSPTLVLNTRRSLRAVHFHPHAAPYLLTAEVNDIDSSDSIMTKATSLGYLQYPPPAVFVIDVHSRERVNLSCELPFMSPFFFMPSHTRNDSRVELQQDNYASGVESSASVQLQVDTNATEQNYVTVSPMDTSSEIPSGSQTNIGHTTHGTFSAIGISNLKTDGMVIDETESSEGIQPENSTNFISSSGRLHGPTRQAGNQEFLSELSQSLQFVPSRDSSGWELPLLQGWFMGQSLVGAPSMPSHLDANGDRLVQQLSSSILPFKSSTNKVEEAMPGGIAISGASKRSGLQNHFSHSRVPESEYWNCVASVIKLNDGTDMQSIASRIHSILATSMASAASAEMPCTVKLRVWSYDIQNPCAPISGDSRRLTIPHAVLCSEMGAHFSPCGRFLAACVACMVPHSEADSGLQALVHQDHGAATSPTRHPILAHQVMYELRIYSLEKTTFGSVLASRAIRAAHCLTSIQFSPTSEHVLLAYGRRHASLLKCVVIDGEQTLPIYTALEVYRVSDMELVGVLPSAEDEVNVACFHPSAGGGIVYGTKEGKLRVLQCDGAHAVNGS